MKKINFINETLYDVKAYEKMILSAFDCVEETNFIVNLIFVGAQKIREINHLFRSKDSVTDVISFANNEIKDQVLSPYNEIGDIFICIERAIEQSQEYGHSVTREIVFLAIHGYLHLNGYDHIKLEEEREMIKKQKEILDKANIRK